MKAVEKARAFGLTDANTPVIGEWCRTVLRKFPNVYSDYLKIWGSGYSSDVQYPNEDSGWMFAFAQYQMPEFDFAGFKEWIRHVDYLRDDEVLVLQSPVFLRHHAPVTRLVVINGELLQPEVPTQGSADSKPDDKGKDEEVEVAQQVVEPVVSATVVAAEVGKFAAKGAKPTSKAGPKNGPSPQTLDKRAERQAKFWLSKTPAEKADLKKKAANKRAAAKSAPPKPKGKGGGIT
jgi:hypothetical protein